MTVSTFNATSANAWRTASSGGGSGGWRDDNTARCGEYLNFGHHKGLWFFNDSSIRSTLSGRTVTSMRLRLTRASSGGSSSSQVPIVRHHNYSSRPSGEPSISSANVTGVGWSWGETDWITLTTGWGPALADGLIRGFAIYQSSDSPYMIFDDNAVLEITHEPDLPATPSGLSITSQTSSGIALDWNDVSNADNYLVDRSDSGTRTTTSSWYSWGSLSSGSSYSFRVLSQNSGGSSSYTGYVTGYTIPSTPTNFQVTSTSDSSVSLSWTASPGNAITRYRVDRDPAHNWITSSTSSTNNWYVDSGSTYQYRIRAENDAGNSAYSGWITAVTVPDTPTNLQGTSSTASSISLSWTAPPGDTLDTYRLQRAWYDGSAWVYTYIPVASGQTTYTDSDSIVAGDLYWYRIRAENSAGSSSYGGGSDSSDWATRRALPPAPGTPTISNVDASSLTVSWPSANGADTYDIERDGVVIATQAGTSFNDTGLGAGQTYDYKVRATNESGDGAWSAVASATTQAFQKSGIYWNAYGGTTLVPRLTITTELATLSVDELVDDFSSLDATKWPTATNVTVGGGKAVLANNGVFWSQERYNFPEDAQMLVKVEAVNPNNIMYFNIQDSLDINNSIGFTVWNEVLYMSQGDTTYRDMSYDSSTHRWLRFRRESNLLHYETSADGVLWSIRVSIAPPAWLSNDLSVRFENIAL